MTQHAGCTVGELPDRDCSPGAYWPEGTGGVICAPGYTRRVRHVTYATKSKVYRAYGLTRHFNGTNGETEHL